MNKAKIGRGRWKLELTSPDGTLKGVDFDAPKILKEFPRLKDNSTVSYDRFQARLRAIMKEDEEFTQAFKILLSAFHPMED